MKILGSVLISSGLTALSLHLASNYDPSNKYVGIIGSIVLALGVFLSIWDQVKNQKEGKLRKLDAEYLRGIGSAIEAYKKAFTIDVSMLQTDIGNAPKAKASLDFHEYYGKAYHKLLKDTLESRTEISNDKLKVMITTFVSIIHQIVVKALQAKDSSVKANSVNINLMLFETLRLQSIFSIFDNKYCIGCPCNYRGFLKIYCWQTKPQFEGAQTGSHLPVAKKSNPSLLLPGAPTAFIEKECKVLPDFKRVDTESLHKKLKEPVAGHLTIMGEHWSSQLSIPLYAGNQTVGVLNILHSTPSYFDNHLLNCLKIYLEPFSSYALGEVLSIASSRQIDVD